MRVEVDEGKYVNLNNCFKEEIFENRDGSYYVLFTATAVSTKFQNSNEDGEFNYAERGGPLTIRSKRFNTKNEATGWYEKNVLIPYNNIIKNITKGKKLW